MKRTRLLLPLFSLLFMLLINVAPTAAQIPSPIDWIPASFDAYVRLDTENAQVTLNDLNISLFVASILQPARFQFTQAQGFDTFFPLDSFDMESTSFTQTIMPWLNNEIIIAYHSLGAQFDASPEETVLILPTRDAFMSASRLQGVIAAQDLLERETYRDVIIYKGDKTALAFLPTAVLVGADALLRETIDTMNGDGEPLTASPVYQQVRAALPETQLLTAYLGSDSAARALSVILSGSAAADPLLSALSDSLSSLNDTHSPERLLLSGALDGIGVSLSYDSLRTQHLTASIVLHTVDTPTTPEAAFDPTVLNFIPRSAMLVHSGADASSAASSVLYSLPLLNFASTALASFPLAGQPSTPTVLPPTPSADDVQAAVSTFLETIDPLVSMQDDLLANLNGSYSLALLPRPNNPVPVLNTPFDVLLVVQTDSAQSAETAQASATTLLETFATPLEDETLGEHTFHTLRVPQTGEPLVRIGAVDNLLLIGTGNAAQQALDAQRGDNRLVQQARWQALATGDDIPYVYIDVNAYYNTFLPVVGGPAARPVRQLGIQSRYLGDNLFELRLQVALAE